MSDVQITKDPTNKSLTVKKTFNAPRDRVWSAWTDGDKLAKWWGPEGWPATTESFDFRPGGHWHYKMTGPDDTESWSMVSYEAIDEPNSLTAVSRFSDVQGITDTSMPGSKWFVEFQSTDEGTLVTTTLTFATDADMQTLVDMGFEGGYSMGLANLERELGQGL